MNPTEQLRQDILTMMEALSMAEREACAKAVEDWGRRVCRSAVAAQAAAEIRARPPFRLPPMAIQYIDCIAPKGSK